MKQDPQAPRVSVIIPAYNAEQFLRETIDSVLDQAGPPFETILVDDGSTDGTAEIARAYGGRIVYHKRDNGGVAEALNTGIAISRGEYIAFLGADDVLLPGSIAVRAAALDRYPAAAFVHGGAYEIDENGTVLRLRGNAAGRPSCEPSSRAFTRLLDGNHVICCTVMARRDHLLAAGGFNQAFVPGEDWAVWLRMAANADVAFVPAPVACYRIHQSSLVARLPFEAYESAHGRVLDAMCGNGILSGRVSPSRAYAAHYRRMALTAAYLRRRRSFLPYFFRALRLRPMQLAEPETWKTAYFGARLLVPRRVLHLARRLIRPASPATAPRTAARTRSS